jgi:uncharacterized membrane protein
MSWLIVGLILFFGIHTVSIISEAWRDRMVEKIGLLSWKGIYSFISIIGLYMMIHGYEVAHQNALTIYQPVSWMKNFSMILQVPVFPLLLAVYIRGRIAATVKHPMLLATILWSASHLLVNGQLTDLLLFGTCLTWAVFDLYSLCGRSQRPLPGAPASRFNDIIAVGVGLVLHYGMIIWGHTAMTGVPLISVAP